MKFILGQKKFMTQVFKDNGTVVPVTAVEVHENVITQVRTMEKDGYTAVQVGSGQTSRNIKKPQQGHLKDLPQSRNLREFRIDPEHMEASDTYNRGVTFGVEIFRAGDSVQVTGTSKGQGFQGVVKRHNFAGAPASHGTKDQLRMPGSIGATGPAHVFKGRRMPGRMGDNQVTVTGLSIVKVDIENNLLYVSGAIPGSINGLVMISGGGTFKPGNVPGKAAAGSDEEASEEKNEDTVEEKPAEKAVEEKPAPEETKEESKEKEDAEEAPKEKAAEEVPESIEDKTEDKEASNESEKK